MPGSILSFPCHHRSRSWGVEETHCRELPSYSDLDGVTSNGDSYAYRYAHSKLTPVP